MGGLLFFVLRLYCFAWFFIAMTGGNGGLVYNFRRNWWDGRKVGEEDGGWEGGLGM